ncbi:hypothetical protein A0H76_856 [Hepatospora eriocheir]|uniref:Uncharacterized protein n=1 Tax=Hepatospora eriocheir TaxID=1081669 RepID=A0A1X0QI31_9MICR|nr:hypothetical protein A0H76_856 [Hepatospora eriocheir]
MNQHLTILTLLILKYIDNTRLEVNNFNDSKESKSNEKSYFFNDSDNEDYKVNENNRDNCIQYLDLYITNLYKYETITVEEFNELIKQSKKAIDFSQNDFIGSVEEVKILFLNIEKFIMKTKHSNLVFENDNEVINFWTNLMNFKLENLKEIQTIFDSCFFFYFKFNLDFLLKNNINNDSVIADVEIYNILFKLTNLILSFSEMGGYVDKIVVLKKQLFKLKITRIGNNEFLQKLEESHNIFMEKFSTIYCNCSSYIAPNLDDVKFENFFDIKKVINFFEHDKTFNIINFYKVGVKQFSILFGVLKKLIDKSENINNESSNSTKGEKIREFQNVKFKFEEITTGYKIILFFCRNLLINNKILSSSNGLNKVHINELKILNDKTEELLKKLKEF